MIKIIIIMYILVLQELTNLKQQVEVVNAKVCKLYYDVNCIISH